MTSREIFKLTVRIIILVVAINILSAIFFLGWLKKNPEFFNAKPAPLAEDGPSFFPHEQLVIQAVEKANPAVVAITISKNVPVYERYLESVPGPFEMFFSVPQYRKKGTVIQEVGGGSGFLVSPDGYIVTNNHVVEDESALYAVFTNDGKKYEARVVDRDPTLDLAIIKVAGTGFPFLPFADSNDLKVGQSVIAIGNALAEFRNTVSLGIISGLSRSIVATGGRNNREELDQLIQIDAAINKGNSGGPLLNLSGEVVGVNVAVATDAENIGFALRSNSVRKMIENLGQPNP